MPTHALRVLPLLLHRACSFGTEVGNTHSFTYCASTNRTASGSAVAKLYCLPIPKGVEALPPVCAPDDVYNVTRRLMAVQKVVEECGFEDIVPRVWTERLDAVLPGIGFHAYWHAIWLEYADGVSVESFLHK